MARENDVHSFKTTLVTQVPGITNALLVTDIPGQQTTALQIVSGGSAVIIGITCGTTLGVTALAGIGNTGSFFVLPATVPFYINGPASFYLASIGATAVVGLAQGKGQGY